MGGPAVGNRPTAVIRRLDGSMARICIEWSEGKGAHVAARRLKRQIASLQLNSLIIWARVAKDGQLGKKQSQLKV